MATRAFVFRAAGGSLPSVTSALPARVLAPFACRKGWRAEQALPEDRGRVGPGLSAIAASIAAGQPERLAAGVCAACALAFPRARARRGRRVAGARLASTTSRGAAAEAASASPGKPKVLFVIGGPGSGKGTQCERIAREFGFVHLSAGELLRAERAMQGSPLGKLIEDAITAGGTVPSEVIAGLLEQAMRKGGWADARFVVDGYPRSEEQLKGWESTLSDKVQLISCLSLEVGREEMRRRVLGRAGTSGRLDDNAATVEKRFSTFVAETGPLLAHFASHGLLAKVDGEGSVDEVWADVRSLVQAADADDSA